MYKLFSTAESLLQIARQVVSDIDIEFVQGTATGVNCLVKDAKPLIKWDVTFWDYLEQTLFITDTLSYEIESDMRQISELFYNFHGILYDHLSKRFAFQPALSSAFIKAAEKYNYPFFKHIYPKAFEVSEFEADYQLQAAACRLITLYHELAHILFSRNKEIKQEYCNMAIHNFSVTLDAFGNNIFDWLRDINPEYFSKEEMQASFAKLQKNDEEYQNLIEEMAADLYAVSKTHATLFMALDDKANSISLSNSIIVAIALFSSTVANYSLLCTFWDSILPQFILSKHIEEKLIQDSVRNLSQAVMLRAQFFTLVLFHTVELLDNAKWQEENEGFFSKRIKIAITKSLKNDKWYVRALNSALETSRFLEILDDAIAIKSDNLLQKLTYDSIPDGALIVTWLSNQYHNNYGLFLQNEGRYIEALREFNISVFISEKTIGHNHRLTARAYNNMVTAMLAIFAEDQSAILLSEIKRYSDVAVAIMDETKFYSDLQATTILQNSGVVAQWSGDTKISIAQYMRARELKLLLFGVYTYSIAVTDSSLSAAYYDLGNLKKAREYCEHALTYLQVKADRSDRYFIACADLLGLINNG